jgi:hypothetical protein
MPNEDARQQEYMVVAPTGVALYSFADLRAAAAEAAELNAGHLAAAGPDLALSLRESATLIAPA